MNKNASQFVVGKVWKKMRAGFPTANELEEVARRQAKEWKTLSFTKKSKITDFWSKAVQKIKSKVANESLPTMYQETTESVTINDKTNLNLRQNTSVCHQYCSSYP